MSYDIVRGLKIDKEKKEVWITSACNNLRPLTYSKWKSVWFSDIYKEHGFVELEKCILEAFWGGSLHSSTNKYAKSLYYCDRTLWSWDMPKEKVEELKDYLHKNYLDFKNRKKGKFIIESLHGWVVRRSSRTLWSNVEKRRAKVFRSAEEAEMYINNFNGEYRIHES